MNLQDRSLTNEGNISALLTGRGLDAARVGATSTSILRFTNLANAIFGLAAADIIAVDDANIGTRILINRAGLWAFSLATTVPATGDLEIGIGRDVALPFIADPDLSVPQVVASQRLTAPAATAIGGSLSFIFVVTPAEAAVGVVGTFLASDGAGAAPAAGDIVAGNTSFQVAYLGPQQVG